MEVSLKVDCLLNNDKKQPPIRLIKLGRKMDVRLMMIITTEQE